MYVFVEFAEFFQFEMMPILASALDNDMIEDQLIAIKYY
jgi:hypothetical protein